MHKFMVVDKAATSNEEVSTAEKLELIRNTLKSHYRLIYESVEGYWCKFRDNGNLTTDNFYNKNIIINDKYNQFQEEFEDLDELFSINVKRWIICAIDGYGKSTLVKEMARQWVKNEKNWTEKFLFLFLFNLNEINKDQLRSLVRLLTNCGLDSADCAFVNKLMDDDVFMKKCLFIFDGLDELKEPFCAEMENFILGLQSSNANIVITSKHWDKLQECNVDASPSVFIELKGYTYNGVLEQLQKHNIDCEISVDLSEMLKVPLFNALFCITQNENPIHRFTLCAAIETFVQFSFSNYRKANKTFTYAKANELMVILGQVAQFQCSFVAKPIASGLWYILEKLGLMTSEIKYPNIPPDILSIALDVGLVYQNISSERLMFPHQTIAEYCAAYFWCKSSPSRMNQILNSELKFSRAEGGSFFSAFIGKFNREYKNLLWQNFRTVVPFLDEYESLPKRLSSENVLNLIHVPANQQNSAMDKMEFLFDKNEKKMFLLHCAIFQTGEKFEHLLSMKELYLNNCTFRITPEEFYNVYKVKSLTFSEGTYIPENKVGGENINPDLDLDALELCSCDYRMAVFLSFALKNCMTLKSLKLKNTFNGRSKKQTELEVGEDYFGHEWINELQRNEKLLFSIEDFVIWCADPEDLSQLFETLGKMMNIRKLELEVNSRNLTKSEKDSLAKAFENGLKNVDEVYLKLTDENGQEIEYLGRLLLS